MIGGVSHLDLLAIARDMRDAATEENTRGLHSALTRLRAALLEHVANEQDDLAALSDSTALIARNGQRRLLALVTDVLFSGSDAGADCNCVVRAVEIDVALRRQARLEAILGCRFEKPGS